MHMEITHTDQPTCTVQPDGPEPHNATKLIVRRIIILS